MITLTEVKDLLQGRGQIVAFDPETVYLITLDEDHIDDYTRDYLMTMLKEHHITAIILVIPKDSLHLLNIRG